MVYHEKFRQERFDNLLLQNNIVDIKEKPFTLKSRRQSHTYANLRKNDAYFVRKVADNILDYTEDHNLKPDCFYGVPEGATRFGIITQHEYAKQNQAKKEEYPLPMGRGKPKDHGDPKNRYFVGEPRGKTIVIEDVTTTGLSTIETLSNLKDLGAEVIGVIGLVNRMEVTPIWGADDGEVVRNYKNNYEKVTGRKYLGPLSVREVIERAGTEYHQLSGFDTLLPKVAEMKKTPRKILDEVEKEFEEYGVKKIKF